MPTNQPRDPHAHPITAGLLRVAAIMATAVVTMGAINSATGSGFACPTWPGCYPGRFWAEAELRPLIEFSHRVVAGVTGPLLLAAAIATLLLPRAHRRSQVLSWIAVVGAIAAAVFGMMTVRDLGLAKPLSVLDLFGALSCLVGATISFLSVRRGGPRWAWTPLARLAGSALAGLYAVHLLGIVVAGKGSFTPVLGWPLWRVVDVDLAPWLQVVRLVLAAATAVALLLVGLRGWRHASVRVPVVVTGVAFVLEAVLGQVVATLGTDPWFSTLYCTAAVAIVSATTLVLGRAALDALD